MTENTAPTANKSPTYRLVAERVEQDTIDYLRDQRNAGSSWRAISLNLWARHNLDVTEVTLRKWWDDAREAEALAAEAAEAATTP